MQPLKENTHLRELLHWRELYIFFLSRHGNHTWHSAGCGQGSTISASRSKTNGREYRLFTWERPSAALSWTQRSRSMYSAYRLAGRYHGQVLWHWPIDIQETKPWSSFRVSFEHRAQCVEVGRSGLDRDKRPQCNLLMTPVVVAQAPEARLSPKTNWKKRSSRGGKYTANYVARRWNNPQSPAEGD